MIFLLDAQLLEHPYIPHRRSSNKPDHLTNLEATSDGAFFAIPPEGLSLENRFWLNIVNSFVQ
jgi:hypothetical protein